MPLTIFGLPDGQITGHHATPAGPRRDDLGEQLARFNLPYVNNAGLAWDGEYLWYVDTDLDKMYQIDFCTLEAVLISAISPLDSRPPSVHLTCPGDSVIMLGDTVHLSWSVEDLFWNDEPCSLHIYGIGCSYDTTIIVPDTVYDWVVPSAATGCDTLWFVVSARDSFCNWGIDSCSVPPICRLALTRILCAPCGGFSGCYDQTAQFAISDPDGYDIDTLRTYFTVSVYHSDGTADTVHLHEPTDSLSFWCYADTLCSIIQVTVQGFTFENNDSVVVSLDSLFNSAGCKTEP